MQLLKKPDTASSESATMAVLMLAGAARNSAIGDNAMRDQHRKLVDQIDWDDVKPWAELRTADSEQLIAELVEYKREHYPNDIRRVMATEMSPEGNVRVHWTEPEKVVTAQFRATHTNAKITKTKRGHPFADKLVKKMNRYVRGKVVDLNAMIAGKKNAEELQKTVATGLEEHVVFTTPYLLIEPDELEWQAYFRRTLPDAPIENRIAAYEHHMKFGPARDYWTEFVFEAYVNHCSDVIFLKGLPDIPESRPHSRVNSQ